MNPHILALKCREMIDNLYDCLKVLESPVVSDREQLRQIWIDWINYAYQPLEKQYDH